MIQEAAINYSPALIANYTYDLVKEFNTYYQNTSILNAQNDELINKLVICINNLKERKMRFGTSEGMILAAGDDESGIFIVSPQTGALPGMKVS